jgi:hypothetical protein
VVGPNTTPQNRLVCLLFGFYFAIVNEVTFVIWLMNLIDVTSKPPMNNLILIEKRFEGKSLPSWQKHVTVRAIFVSIMMSVMFTFIVMKLNLTTRIIPSLNVSTGLLGFFFVKTWTKLFEKAGWLNQPFTRHENILDYNPLD